MGKTSTIEWTQATWNPWIGCHEVSPGCAHCYAKTLQTRWGHDFGTLRRTADASFYSPIRWREPRVIFTCSLSDFFHPDADAWRPEVWDIIEATPLHTYQILTKRPELIADRLPKGWGRGWPNVWLGVSIENQRFAGRALQLLDTPAQVRWLSCEPLLGPLDLTRIEVIPNSYNANGTLRRSGVRVDALSGLHVESRVPRNVHGIDWVVVGGESGARCRPMELDWARALRDQCAAAEVAFFLKQLGGKSDKRGGDAALLDGQLYHGTPR